MRSRRNSNNSDNAYSSDYEEAIWDMNPSSASSSLNSSPRFFREGFWPFDNDNHEYIHEAERQKAQDLLIQFCKEVSHYFLPAAPQASPEKKTQKRSRIKISSVVRRSLFTSPRPSSTPSILDQALNQLTSKYDEDSSSSEEKICNPLDIEFDKQIRILQQQLKAMGEHRKLNFYDQYGMHNLSQEELTEIEALSPAKLVMLLYLSSKSEQANWREILDQIQKPTDNILDHFIRIKNGELAEEKSEESDSDEIEFLFFPPSL